jgi:hypothetical protein
VAADPNDESFQMCLGMVLFRAERIEEGVQRLSGLTEHPVPRGVRSSHAYGWFFLAMAHHRLGHPEEARRWLAKAIAQADREIGPLPGLSTAAWNAKTTLQMFRQEALTAFSPTTRPVPTASPGIPFLRP